MSPESSTESPDLRLRADDVTPGDEHGTIRSTVSRPAFRALAKNSRRRSVSGWVLGLVAGIAAASSATAQDAPVSEFEQAIRPLLASACIHCHSSQRSEGELNLETLRAAQVGGDLGPALVPGDPSSSSLYTTTVLPADDDHRMPTEGAPLSPWQAERLADWIRDGADWPADARIAETPRIDFVKHIQPILEQNCVGCHKADKSEGGLDLTTLATAFAEADSGIAIVPFDVAASSLHGRLVLDADDDSLMPPKSAGGPLSAEQIGLIRDWIAQGANWPEGLELTQRERVASTRQTPDTLELTRQLHAMIVATAERERAAGGGFDDYDSQVPRTGAKYSMIALEGGEFLMGSPADEADRRDDEGPQVPVTVSPFWIGKFEVTWDEYEPFMINGADRFKWGARRDYDANIHELVDAVSQPTAPYTEMSFGMGQRGYPAISMTQHAANKYCQWLSAQTGHFYRLATEAEWEYACRAGTTTAYSFGDDPAAIGQYAWYYDNANEKYQKVGLKKPNPWGIHDMHGNVMEWVADQYVPDYFAQLGASPTNPLIRAVTEHPRSVRGGGWDDDPDRLRSAARRGSEPEWKQQDPQLPKSLWYHTNARWLGFRIVRPVEIPSVEEMHHYWNSGDPNQ